MTVRIWEVPSSNLARVTSCLDRFSLENIGTIH